MVKRNHVNIAVLVSGGGTNLQALIDSGKRGELKSGRITLVVSNKSDAYALERAEKAGIPTFVTKDEDEMIAELKKAEIDLVILAGFMKILSPEFIRHYPDRIINVHPALIPSFCGRGAYGIHVHEMALDYGVKVTGATVHFVNEIPDGGRIIDQKAVSVLDSDTPETLQKRVMKQAEWVILPKAAESVSNNILNSWNK